MCFVDALDVPRCLVVVVLFLLLVVVGLLVDDVDVVNRCHPFFVDDVVDDNV